MARELAKEAVVADALKAAWQDMDQEPANEFVSRQRHRRVAIVAAIILPTEAHFAVTAQIQRAPAPFRTVLCEAATTPSGSPGRAGRASPPFHDRPTRPTSTSGDSRNNRSRKRSGNGRNSGWRRSGCDHFGARRRWRGARRRRRGPDGCRRPPARTCRSRSAGRRPHNRPGSHRDAAPPARVLRPEAQGRPCHPCRKPPVRHP